MPTLILDLFKITLPHQPDRRRHLGINYLVPSTAGDRERINLASLRRQHVASMQSRLPLSSNSSRDAHAHASLGLETWDDGTVELRGFPIEDILVVRMVNKMTGETDTSYELHFEYVFDAERVADLLGLAAGPPVEKDEGPGGWRGWVVTVPKRVHHRSQMWERCMERDMRLGDRDRERERERDLRDRDMRDRLGDRDRDRERERDLRERDRERDMRDMRDSPRDGGFREVQERRSMIPIPIQPPPRDRDGGFREVERRSMIPIPIPSPQHPEPPRLKVRKSQRF